MKVVVNPDRKEWKALLQRPYVNNSAVLRSVTEILNEVKQNGDEAVRAFTKKFDGIALENFEVTKEEIEIGAGHLPDELKNAIHRAAHNIETFHAKQIDATEIIETMPGVECWRRNVGIEKVGLYIPGGTAPLFSTVLMLAIPAKLAGCREVILCTPANWEGKIHPAILFCAKLAGVGKIFKAGGAQAIAAMAYGTESIPAVYKIFGPGNQYVTAAKQLVQMDGIAIDMPAGPSELCVLADETAEASFVAADLLSQAEHGKDSQVLLVSTSEAFVKEVNDEIEIQLANLSRKTIAEKPLEHSKSIIISSLDEAVELVNEYAPEHLILACRNGDKIGEQIKNAGSIFIGNYSPESVGDYASGTNHTLPTNGFAKAYSGVSLDSFVKKITYQKLSPDGLREIGEAVMRMAEAEGLEAHSNAVKIRMNRN